MDEKEITKIDDNTFKVEQTTASMVKKDGLIQEIADLEEQIAKKREVANLDAMEADLASKQALLEQINEKA